MPQTQNKKSMKRSGIWIIILIILIAIFWWYCDSQKKKLEKEKEVAVAEAVDSALAAYESYQNVHEPPVRTKIVFVEKEAPKEKKKAPAKPANIFTDDRDGKQYKYMENEDHRWMAQNLDYASEDSWCYEGDVKNCEMWGRTYTWNAAMEACPDGWRLPSEEEWDKLIWAYGGNEVAGRHLKAGGSSDFEILMAGYRDKKGFYGKADTSAYFWTSTESPKDARYAFFRGFYKEYSNVGPYPYTKADGLSVRCIQDK
jgi:uncharacterized protein (TIGR02145 family)